MDVRSGVQGLRHWDSIDGFESRQQDFRGLPLTIVQYISRVYESKNQEDMNDVGKLIKTPLTGSKGNEKAENNAVGLNENSNDEDYFFF